jgi:hypothetical protein
MLVHLVTASYSTLQWAASMRAWALAQASAHDENPGGTPNVLFTSKPGHAIADAQIDSQLGGLALEPPPHVAVARHTSTRSGRMRFGNASRVPEPGPLPPRAVSKRADGQTGVRSCAIMIGHIVAATLGTGRFKLACCTA